MLAEESTGVRPFWAGVEGSDELGERSFFSALRLEPGMTGMQAGRRQGRKSSWSTEEKERSEAAECKGRMGECGKTCVQG